MNYRHAFHAGNFADVVKHAVLARLLVHLRSKPAAYRVIDTHAGAGVYDLGGPEATRSPEWQGGIARLYGANLNPALGSLLAPYLDVVAAHNASGGLRTYPGSPALTHAFLRTQDRLLACELEPHAAALLKRLSHDRRVKVVAIDGWTALNAYVPPPERRGVVLVDPPYEDAGDFLNQAIEQAHRKWASGIYLLWYPIKGRREPDALARRLRRSGINKILRAELNLCPADPARLTGCGLILVNPPWRLDEELALLLGGLAPILAGGDGGNARIDWIAGEL
jgi:23S rRNA (adenine2030-N6)-methyltransferase